MDLKTQIDPNILVVGDFNTPLPQIIRLPRKKKNQEILELNDTDLMTDLIYNEQI
jgi:hypothetical protein